MADGQWKGNICLLFRSVLIFARAAIARKRSRRRAGKCAAMWGDRAGAVFLSCYGAIDSQIINQQIKSYAILFVFYSLYKI
ncbi:hypothetical protein EBL_c19450 [Shimwellia blattae DSM 4481 = NBRC 105725]|uniref:Uncharacterized protein n=1 Tax=Shimwellia blattae (strain ATCC 29907 / DSM 4481 / JCM 1650 / NBRC 105725 / CDC 9005-74) TaxID=630626 RepID=I2B933_SHIBC|nr:hypothetical protein EBL_c19450 [Shimwellia blattae DSM 4481 = NBRC 105725]